jgi:phenylacetate-coenzyme A ligase PaaK-like adenylate-forming protein
MHTSGTSGEVGYFLYAPDDYKRMNAGRRRNGTMLRALLRKRSNRLRRLRLAFYGATGGHYAGVTSLALMQRGLLRLFVRARAFEVNTPLAAIVGGLNDFQPELLFGYTTALKMLAGEQRAGRLDIAPIAVLASGEVTTGNDMALLAAAFGGASTFSIYACTEHMAMGISNPDGDTMTLMDDNLVFELYGDHSVVTNLCNFTMPMIRYRMSDILHQVSAPDARHIVIRNLVGRCEQMPTFTNSAGNTDFLSPHTINEIFVPGVTRFQMRITGTSSFFFPICVEPGLNDPARAAAVTGVARRLREILGQKGLDNVTFEARIVDDIPLNARTRKFQLIVDERAAPP